MLDPEEEMIQNQNFFAMKMFVKGLAIGIIVLSSLRVLELVLLHLGIGV